LDVLVKSIKRAISDLYPTPNCRTNADKRKLQLIQESGGFPLPGFGSPGWCQEVGVDAVQEFSGGTQHRPLLLRLSRKKRVRNSPHHADGVDCRELQGPTSQPLPKLFR
jgi:hypothetical protein